MLVLPEHDRKITQRTIGRGHRYKVEGLNCNTCANCRKGKACIGLPSVTGFTGKYGDGDMYGAGYRAAFNTVFGAYTDRDKTTLDGTGILDMPISASAITLRQDAEAIKTPSQVGMAVGTEVHSMLQDWLQARMDGTEVFLSGDHIEQARRIVDWLDQHECEILDVEVNLYHPVMLYGGQVDCIARRGNSLLVLDWKSGKGVYKDYAAQVAAYAMAYQSMTGERVDEGWVLRSGVDGSFEALKIADLGAAKLLFMHLMTTKESWDTIEWEDGTK
jgi:hypothetical protein